METCYRQIREDMRIIEITDIQDEKLDIYARTNEAQLLHYYEPEEGVFIAESPMIIERALEAGYEPLSFLIERRYIEGQGKHILTQYEDVPIYVAELDVLTKLTGYQITRGMLCAMRRKKTLDIPQICENARRIVILEDVMNPTNVGAIFRSAAALGMDAMLLTEGCADPLYRRASRVSMGTVFQMPWTTFSKKNPWKEEQGRLYGMEQLRQLGYKFVAMALCEDSIAISDPRLQAEEKLAILMGTEGEGLCQNTIDACDYTVKIPMAHGVDSLNVAAASAVAFWELSK